MIGAHLTGDVTSVSAPGGVVTLVEGRSFCLSSASGDIIPSAAQGLFVLDVRALSRWELRVNGRPVEALSVDLKEPYAADFAGRSHPPPGQSDAELAVFRRRRVGRGLCERIEVMNHGTTPGEVLVELVCDVDFAGIFEVKSGRVASRIDRHSARTGDHALCFSSGNGAGHTEVTITASEPAIIEPGRLTWRPTLGPRERWEVCCEIGVAVDGQPLEPTFRCGRPEEEAIPTRRLASWRTALTDVRSACPDLDAVIVRSGEDLGSLRIYDHEHPDVPILAAGAPWYMTLFGRDSLLTAWMTLIADRSLAVGVLDTLARLQGNDVDDRTEEEPGKILHEVRLDLADGLTLARADVYYGTIDATPLFVMLLGEARRWGLDDDTLHRLLPHADRALEWDRAVRRPGRRRLRRVPAPHTRRSGQPGLEGLLGRDPLRQRRLPPTADRPLRSAGLRLRRLPRAGPPGPRTRDDATARRYQQKAAELRRQFNEDFWLDDRGWYVLALDAAKRPIDAVASNIGHCLWTEIVDPERAAIVAERMLTPELFSGWGMRTLATSMAAYNPVSYHNGSVWPHDNAIAAAGLARYGFADHAARIVQAQLEVATRCDGRLPELFAGFSRADFGAPAAYPSSCSPQAWAAAAPLLWLRALLRFDPSLPQRRLWLQPQLPAWVGQLHADGIEVGDRKLSVHVTGDHVEVEGADSLHVLTTARPSLASMLDPPDGTLLRRR